MSHLSVYVQYNRSNASPCFWAHNAFFFISRVINFSILIPWEHDRLFAKNGKKRVSKLALLLLLYIEILYSHVLYITDAVNACGIRIMYYINVYSVNGTVLHIQCMYIHTCM